MARLVPSRGNPLHLDPKTPITIGSSIDSGLQLTDPGVADVHCVLRALQDGGYGLKDLGSEVGTKVNGRNIRAVRLKHGDHIQIGSQDILFEDIVVEDADSAAPTQKTPSPKRPAAAQDDDPWLTGTTQIAGYQVHSLLGSGGMGRVYEATQLSLHRKVAFKVLNSELASDPAFVESFLLEARASARFNHPNVVQVFDVDEADGRPFYSMELLTESLEERLKREGRLQAEDAIGVIRDAAQGLAYAAQLGLVHRDVKPDNLMMDKDGRTKLCDLGLASSIEKSHEGKVAGTPHFMPPEQIRKTAMDQRSDLYSLGCTFWRLLTGKNVFSGKTVREILKAQLETPPPRLREHLPEASEELENILLRLLAKDPEERYEHADALAEDLQTLLEEKHKSHRALALGLGAIVVVLAVVLVIILNQGTEKEIQVITETNPDAAKQQLALRESNAEVALLRVPDSGDMENRAKAYETVAREHAGTKAGKRAAQQAAQIRTELGRLAAVALTEKQRIEKLARTVTQAGQEERATGRLEAAWRTSLTSAGERPRPPKIDQVLDGIRASLLQDLQKRVDDALEELKESLSGQQSDPVNLRESFQEKLRPQGKDAAGNRLSWTLPGAAALLQGPMEEGATEIRNVVVARAKSKRAERQNLLKRRRELLLGKDGAMALLAMHRFKAAAQRLRSIAAPKGLEGHWRGIQDLGEICEDADGALAALVAVRGEKGEPRTFDLAGVEARYSSFNGTTLILETGKGRRTKKHQLDPWKEAALLEQILTSSTKLPAEVEKGRQALILTLNLLDLVPQGQNLLHGASNGGPPEAVPLDRGRMALMHRQQWILPAHAREGQALLLLGRLLTAWNAKADLQAKDAIRRLEKGYRNSAVGIALGIPSTASANDESR